MSALNVNATEWRPSGAVLMNLELPPSTGNATAQSTLPPPTPHQTPRTEFYPGVRPYMPAPPSLPPQEAYDLYHMAATNALLYSTPKPSAATMADYSTLQSPYLPTFNLPTQMLAPTGLIGTATTGTSALPDLDWAAEFAKVMNLTEKMIEQQRSGYPDDHTITQRNHHAVQSALGANVRPATTTTRTPPISAAAAPAPNSSAPVTPSQEPDRTEVAHSKPADAHAGSAPARHEGTSTASQGSLDDDSSLPPLTAKGNRRWKKLTKAQQRRDQVQKSAFEAFASALLHSVSPFMAPLREKCKTSLPHLKLDQRFGKNGQPQTAIAQFIVAPLVTNYRPRHFHDLTPGDVMEFHYDMAQVMAQLSSAYGIIIGYGPVWKRYAVPYCYVACKEYRKEVLALCPNEVPNTRAEAIYRDDIVKDITEVVLAVEELEALQRMSILQAMRKRVNLAPLYDALDAIFRPLENYRIEIYGLYDVPSTFLLKTSKIDLEQKPQPIVLYGDARLWYDLPLATPPHLDSATTPPESGLVTPGNVTGNGVHPVTAAATCDMEVHQGKNGASASLGTRPTLRDAAPYTPALLQPTAATPFGGGVPAAVQSSTRANSKVSTAWWREPSMTHLPAVLGALGGVVAVGALFWRYRKAKP